jgi:hypothetical protein
LLLERRNGWQIAEQAGDAGPDLMPRFDQNGFLRYGRRLREGLR